MRAARLLAPEGEEGVYHVVSRVVDRRMVFGNGEKRRFLRLAKGYAVFSGIDLVSWCVMGNHFHLILRIRAEDPAGLDQEEILRRLRAIYTNVEMREIEQDLELAGSAAGRRGYLQRYTDRMGSLGKYMKIVKQRFSQWFNRVHERKGTLWEDRYKSTLLEVTAPEDRGQEGLGLVARIVGAYIDLNPVRARMVDDPKDYGWSSYGAALRGDRVAEAGLKALWGAERGRVEVLGAHRMFLYEEGSEDRVPTEGEKAKRFGIEAAKVWKERKRGGRLPLAVILRLRVRYLTDGAVLGSPQFVGKVMGKRADGRLRCGEAMAYGEWGGLHAGRRLRGQVTGADI